MSNASNMRGRLNRSGRMPRKQRINMAFERVYTGQARHSKIWLKGSAGFQGMNQYTRYIQMLRMQILGAPKISSHQMSPAQSFIHGRARFPHADPVLREAYCYLTTALAFTDTWVELGIGAEIDKAMKNVNAILSGNLDKLENL